MAGIGGEHEMRKDRPLSSGSRLYRIYLDNFDLLEKTESRLACKIKGGVADAVAQVRDMYETMGLPRHPKKSVQRALQGEVQGAVLDGEAGFAVPKPEKAQVYCKLADELRSMHIEGTTGCLWGLHLHLYVLARFVVLPE